MHSLFNDVHYALRQLRKSPGFTFTVVLTLALGVGANAVVFSVLNALILRPLPLPDATQLVFLDRFNGPGTSASSTQSDPDYRELRDGNRTFSGLIAYRTQRGGVGVAGAIRQSWFYEASENYFDVLGIQPALGRSFHPSDAHGPNSAPYAVLSYSYWQRHFDGDATIAGKVIELNKHPFTVLGVAPKNFAGTELFVSPDLWVPMLDQELLDGYSNYNARGNHGTWVLLRRWGVRQGFL